MKLRALAPLLLLPAAAFLAGCTAYAYDDEPVGAYGYYEPNIYYARTPRYYRYGYERGYYRNYDRYPRDFDRGHPRDFDHGHPGNFDHGHPVANHGEPPHAPAGGNDHHAFVAPDGGPHGEVGHPDGGQR